MGFHSLNAMLARESTVVILLLVYNTDRPPLCTVWWVLSTSNIDKYCQR